MAAHHHIQPEQLKMFMTANEILEHWGPLDLDRQQTGGGTYGSFTRDPGSENPTARSFRGHNTERTSGGSKLYHRVGGVESDEELWSRKAEEAGDYGLTDSILEEGVKKPVSLGFSTGSTGKREVVGGHHRLAVMREESPDEYIPVVHYPNFYQAKSDPKYT